MTKGIKQAERQNHTIIIAQGACKAIMDDYKKNHDQNIKNISINGIIFADDEKDIFVKATYDLKVYKVYVMSEDKKSLIDNTTEVNEKINNKIYNIDPAVVARSGNNYVVNSKKGYFDGTAIFK